MLRQMEDWSYCHLIIDTDMEKENKSKDKSLCS